ncbi:MAG: hypothetical protein HQ564_07610 [Candidatus Saganbacteria bacterium]|nr:hypothetical protein [Candidatus Saganbacteria bacterium]
MLHLVISRIDIGYSIESGHLIDIKIALPLIESGQPQEAIKATNHLYFNVAGSVTKKG